MSNTPSLKIAEPGKPALSIAREVPEKRLHIMVVDCSDVLVPHVRYALQNLPIAKLDFVNTPQAASAALAADRFDLVVIDPRTPDCFVLLREIKDKYRWVSTLVATTNQAPAYLRQVVSCGIDALLFRPTTVEEFQEQVMLLAKAASMRRQRQQKRVLAIGAHPDDVEIGCGGAIAKHHAAGDLLHILTLSRGAAGGDVNVRIAEAQQAAATLGAELHLGNLKDTYIDDGRETIDMIHGVVREMGPTHVYTHAAQDTHQDHRAVHAASLVAARSVPNLYCYQAPSSTVEFSPNRFVDITDFIGAKLQAIDIYGSQDRMAALEPENVVATARYWGRFAGYVMAEPMLVVRQRDNEEGIKFDKAVLTGGLLQSPR